MGIARSTVFRFPCCGIGMEHEAYMYLNDDLFLVLIRASNGQRFSTGNARRWKATVSGSTMLQDVGGL